MKTALLVLLLLLSACVPTDDSNGDSVELASVSERGEAVAVVNMPEAIRYRFDCIDWDATNLTRVEGNMTVAHRRFAEEEYRTIYLENPKFVYRMRIPVYEENVSMASNIFPAYHSFDCRVEVRTKGTVEIYDEGYVQNVSFYDFDLLPFYCETHENITADIECNAHAVEQQLAFRVNEKIESAARGALGDGVWYG